MHVTIHPGKLQGTVGAPPSKSITHRAIILASLAVGESVIESCLVAEDTKRTMEACVNFGAGITEIGNTLKVQGTGGMLRTPSTPVDCGLSGTTLRFTLALAALADGPSVFRGEKRLWERPLRPLIDALHAIGARIDERHFAITVSRGSMRGGYVKVPGDVSSQFISALLMIAPFVTQGISVTVEKPFYSRPYIDLTIDLMRAFGVNVGVYGNRFSVEPDQAYRARQYRIEGDYSSAQYWCAAAALTGGEVRVGRLRADSKQGDRRLLDILSMTGCEIAWDEDTVTVRGGTHLKPFSVDGRDIPDAVPTLALLGAAANGVSEITHIGHLRGKESDRLAAPVEELKKMGIRAKTRGDSLRVYGGKLHGAHVHPHGDHRIAMAFAIAGLAAEGDTVLQNAEVVRKSYPWFWSELEKLGGKIAREG